MKLIPTLGSKGTYVLKEPFNQSIRSNEIYECGAIRYFKDLENNGTNVFNIYYKPFNLDESDYKKDRDSGQVLITLLSPKYAPVYVPSSYIESFPSLDSKPYNQVILTASLGALPDDVILDDTINTMQDVLSDAIGVTVTVHTSIMPLSDAVSPTEHATQEAARLGAIGTRETNYSRVSELEALNYTLKQNIGILEQIVKAHGLLD